MQLKGRKTGRGMLFIYAPRDFVREIPDFFTVDIEPEKFQARSREAPPNKGATKV